MAFAFLALMAGGVFLPAISLSSGPGKSRLQILAPAKGAAMPVGAALLIGKAAGEGMRSVEIEVNGKGKQSVAVNRGGFYAQVSLSAGRNVISARAGGESAVIEVSASKKGTYVYHSPVKKCAECHGTGGTGYAIGAGKDTICYRCHARKDKKRLVHGPMGSGDCTACHDPHGSAGKGLTVARADQLCVSCHDQKTSREHIAKSRGKTCTACHDPHSSDKVFLLR